MAATENDEVRSSWTTYVEDDPGVENDAWKARIVNDPSPDVTVEHLKHLILSGPWRID